MAKNTEIFTQLPKQKRDELISALYETVLYPEKYDQLMHAWHDYLYPTFNNQSAQPDDVNQLLETDNSLSDHFARVMPMLEQVLLAQQTAEKSAINSAQIPEIRISKQAKITSINSAASALFGKNISFEKLLNYIDSDSINRPKELVNLLSSANKNPQQKFFIFIIPNNKPLHFVAKQVTDDNGQPELLLQSLAILWSQSLSDDLAKVYELSQTEITVTKQISAGATLAEIGIEIDRSIFTIRAHTKSILKKTHSATKNDLVRLVSLMSQAIGSKPAQPSNLTNTPAEMQKLTLPDGRKMQIYSYGANNGVEAILVHGFLEGAELIKRNEKLLKKMGIKFICPIRASFGASDAHNSTKNALNIFAADLMFMTQQLKLKKPVLVGLMAGAVYAYAAAKHAQNLYSSIVNVSGGVPIVCKSQLGDLNLRQKTIGYAARYTPKLLPLLLHTGMNQINSPSAIKFLEALYPKTSPDWQLIEKQNLQDIIIEGYKFSAQQGYNGFATDIYHTTKDWSYLLENNSIPICLIHGSHAIAVPIESVRNFAKTYASVQLHEVKDAGQLIFYQKPEYILSQIRDFHLSNK